MRRHIEIAIVAAITTTILFRVKALRTNLLGIA